jgi:undecaprenyl diphosphate synthase
MTIRRTRARACAALLRSEQVSRIDLIVRWGGGRRLSGFLPVESVYADIYVEDAPWPDFEPASRPASGRPPSQHGRALHLDYSYPRAFL